MPRFKARHTGKAASGARLLVKVFIALLMLALIGFLLKYLGSMAKPDIPEEHPASVLIREGVRIYAPSGISNWGYLSDTLVLLDVEGDFSLRVDSAEVPVFWNSPGGMFLIEKGALAVREVPGGWEFRLHSGLMFLDPLSLNIAYQKGKTYQILEDGGMVTISSRGDY